MEHKSFPIEVKADAQSGEFEALVAVFGNVDAGGDRIEKGAFARTLKDRGLPPIVWSHEWGTPPIGVTTSAAETDEGLMLKGRLFVGPGEDHAVARQVYAAMKATDGDGRSPLREFSFGYETRGYRMEAKDGGGEVRVLTDVELLEAGPTLVGMNPETRLVSVKADAPVATITTTNTTNTTSPSEPDDKPVPSAPQAGEEDQARIGLLLAQRPIHHTGDAA